MKKKFLVLLMLLVAFVISGCSKGVKVELDDFEYEVIGNEILLKKYIGSETEVIVKDSYNQMNAYINGETFRNNTNVTSVTLASGFYSLADYAFEGCTNLKEVDLKDIHKVGKYAFKGCVNLEKIKIGARDIDETAFIDCCNLTVIDSTFYSDKKKTMIFDEGTYTVLLAGKNAEIPDNAVRIAPYAFYGRSGITKVTIPGSVEEIGVNAFGGCSDLKVLKVSLDNKVYDSRDNSNAIIERATDKLIAGISTTIIPNGVKIIGTHAFDNVASLTGINIPSTVKTIEEDAFFECGNVESITVNPNNNNYDSRENSNAIIETATNKLIFACETTSVPTSVKVIGKNSYNSVDKLQTLNLSEGIEVIEEEAFFNMNSLKELIISSTVKEIGLNIINKSNITSLSVNEANEVYDSRNNSNAIIKTSENKIIYGIKLSVIDPTITTIGSHAFSNNNSLEEIRIPDTITEIEANAYSNCENVLVIKLSDSITTIGEEAFMGCTKVESITIPNSVTSIGAKAFANCNLWSIKVDEANQVYDSRDGSDAIIETATNKLVVASSNTTIPDSVTSIAKYAFYGINYKNIYIGKNITNIESGAFVYLSNIISIKVDEANEVYDSRKYVDFYKDEFESNCIIETATNKLVLGCAYTILPEGVTSIGDYAFCGNDNLLGLHLDKEIASIGAYAFSDCSSFFNRNISK